MHRRRPLLCCLFVLVAPLLAQDPARDLPWRRTQPERQKDAQIELAAQRLAAGWGWEAARCAREARLADDRDPLPHLLLALSFRDEPNRCARLIWDAWQRREAAGPIGRKLLTIYQEHFGVTSQPELVDARFAQAPDRATVPLLLRKLRMLSEEAVGVTDDVAAEVTPWLVQHERRPMGDPMPIDGDELRRDAFQAHNAWLAQRAAMPFQVPGYGAMLERVLADAPEAERRRRLEQLPRHPQHPYGPRVVFPLPGFAERAGLAWQPRTAAPFDLPDGVGGRGALADYAGKPVLVVFFLGFGCAHCVAQLQDLDPKAPRFREAGIEVVTIGTDDLDEVRAARQAADENGVDPLHFDVLCDPKGEVFKRWGCWDEFGDEALHGTFLVDGKGRVLWQDISLRPFEQSDWLLGECKRLLAAWRDV